MAFANACAASGNETLPCAITTRGGSVGSGDDVYQWIINLLGVGRFEISQRVRL